MTKAPSPEETWIDNAALWTEVVRAGGIASRRLATDQAICEAILALSPKSVLDLGCGEGWLARRLWASGVPVVGTDSSAPLIEAANAAGGGTFHRLDYAALAARPDRFGHPFDVIAANFSLLGDDLAPLLGALPAVVRPGGALIVQTMHPLSVEPPYADGWRRESFEAFGGAPWTPMPWYFRTLGSWHALFSRAWTVVHIAEPLHPETGRPLSLLVTLRPKD